MPSGRRIQTLAWLAAAVCLTGFDFRPIRAADDSMIEFIDTQLVQSWADNEVKPAAEATNAEWLRRVYLDIVGRIPSVTECDEWSDNPSPRRKAELIDRLMDDPDYIRNFTTIWTNHCIGRGTPRRVSRKSLEKFFREAFAKNRPWNDVVYDLITAEGHFEENGAVNYILAQTQMADNAVQLTAKTTKLFLGIQVQCTQCHNHPFNDWQQNQFWEFNSFFRQVDRIDHRRQDPGTGRLVDDYSEVVRQDFTGPVYFEKRSGLMQVAFPKLSGQAVDPGSEDRRGELGRLLIAPPQDETPLIALAFVNRMWAHFFGYGFTRPIDDMGPHNPPSHPEVLERLAAEFVKEKYDIRELIRWITNTRAYSLSSQFDAENSIDNPGGGEMPLFSHAYLRSMEAEQLYDSLIVATTAHQSGRAGWEDQEAQRRRWMQQFVVAFDNDENLETTTFNGTIPQALMLMNGELTETAVSAQPGSFLHDVLSSQENDAQKIQKLYRAALSRMPTRGEQAKARRLFRQYGPNGRVTAFQDLFWALLNSNEFIFIH